MTKFKYVAVALIALALVFPASTFAQGGGTQFNRGSSGTAPQSAPWEQFKLDPNKKLRLSFRNASVDMVLEFFGNESGVPIVKDPKLTQKLTLISPNEVTLNDAFAMLSAQLGMLNFTMEKSGNMLVIKARQERDNDGRDNGFGGMSQEQIAELFGGQRQQTELRVYRIEFANASEVARVVNEVFWTREQSNNPFQQFMQFGNQGRNQGRNNRGGGFNFQQGGGQGGPTVRASYDDFSNTVIVNAPRNTHFEVEALIEEIDQQTSAPQVSRVYKLDWATAVDVAPTVQSVLAANEVTGRGGQSPAGNTDFLSRINRMRSGVTAGGSVVADDRTNSLVVTATAQNQDVIAQVINELDTEVEYVDSAVVLPLNNARAADVATLLNQAFGARTTGNRFGTGNTRNQNNRNQNNRNQNNRNQGGGGRGGGGFGGELMGSEDDPNNYLLDFEDPEALYGELLTQVSTGGGIIAQANQQVGGTARNAAGQIVNTRQAQGQVTIIADPQTNSLIVVGDPENAEMIRNILAQLDRIPEQVMIETIIVEATLDSSTKLGIEWDLANGKFLGNPGVSGSGGSNFGLQTTPAAQGFSYAVTGGALGGFLNALQTDDKFKVLSTPRIFTSNNVQAEINISQSVPFIVSQREDVNGNFIFNYSFQDVGIVLTVTPRITANGMVTLDVVQTANDLQGFTDFNAPIVNQRQAQTTVSAMDGETIVIGGIMRSQVRSTTKKIPLLGDIPILGALFRSTDKREEKTELLVFLTPRIVRSPEEAKKLTDDQVGQLSDAAKNSYNKVRPPVTTGGTGNGGAATGGAGGNK